MKQAEDMGGKDHRVLLWFIHPPPRPTGSSECAAGVKTTQSTALDSMTEQATQLSIFTHKVAPKRSTNSK